MVYTVQYNCTVYSVQSIKSLSFLKNNDILALSATLLNYMDYVNNNLNIFA